jgi:prophage regulatory protein
MDMDVLLPEPVVLKYIAYGRTKLWQMVRSGEFPPPRRVGPNRRAWLASEIQEWIKTRPVSLNAEAGNER